MSLHGLNIWLSKIASIFHNVCHPPPGRSVMDTISVWKPQRQGPLSTSSQCFLLEKYSHLELWNLCWFLVSRNVCRGKLKWSEHVESILGPWRQTISVSGGPEPRLRGKRRKAHARTHACAVIQDHHKWPCFAPFAQISGPVLVSVQP